MAEEIDEIKTIVECFQNVMNRYAGFDELAEEYMSFNRDAKGVFGEKYLCKPIKLGNKKYKVRGLTGLRYKDMETSYGLTKINEKTTKGKGAQNIISFLISDDKQRQVGPLERCPLSEEEAVLTCEKLCAEIPAWNNTRKTIIGISELFEDKSCIVDAVYSFPFFINPMGLMMSFVLSRIIGFTVFPRIIKPRIDDWIPWMPIMNATLAIQAISCAEKNKVQKKTLRVFLMERIYDFDDLKTKLIQLFNICPIAARRLHIIEDCISAHENNQFNLTLPVLLAQFDGLFVDYYNNRFPDRGQINRFSKKSFKTYSIKVSEELYHSNYTGEFLHDSIVARGKALDYSGEDTSPTQKLWNKYIEDTVFGKRRKDFSVWRHGILHGREIDYGGEWNSLLGFLLLFDLSVVEYIIREGEK